MTNAQRKLLDRLYLEGRDMTPKSNDEVIYQVPEHVMRDIGDAMFTAGLLIEALLSGRNDP